MSRNNLEDRSGSYKKLIVVGDRGSGKTSLLNRFAKDESPTGYTPTVFENMVTSLETDGKIVELMLCDPSGQEKLDCIRRQGYSDTDVVLVCFAFDNPDSFENVRKVWIPEVQHFCRNAPIILVGNNKDLENDPEVVSELQKRHQKPVTTSEGKNVAHETGIFAYVENSVKTGEGVEEVFRTACRAIRVDRPQPRPKWRLGFC